MKPLKPAFTLIEILIVVAIIVVLLGMTTQMIGAASDSQNRSKAITDMAALATALESFNATYGVYPKLATPSNEKENSAKLYKCLTGRMYMAIDNNGRITFKEGKREAFVKASIDISNAKGDEDVDPDAPDAFFVDPWGNPYVYIYDTSTSAGKLGSWESPTFILLSKGADGKSVISSNMIEEGYIGDVASYRKKEGNDDDIINGID
ncbi:MAG: prepilin-type N-terminal cleavage/methylation domain-containing protein [Opitutales bacterium]